MRSKALASGWAKLAVIAVTCAAVFGASPSQAAVHCDVTAISALPGHQVSIASATDVAAAGNTPAYCDVKARLITSGNDAPNGEAQFELRLPVRWNGKFLFLGVGGLAGATYADLSVNRIDGALALAKGYATAITDMGHQAERTDARWAIDSAGRPAKAKIVDYLYRATHSVTVAAKALIQRFYDGRRIDRAYFDGCSNGGRQGLIEATRYPEDFDGIIAGDPFLDMHYFLNGIRLAKQVTGGGNVPPALLRMVDDAVMASCDDADGVKDGLIQNPAKCTFDVRRLRCSPGQTRQCLSEGQVAALSSYVSPLRTATGKLLYPGYAASDLATYGTGVPGGGADKWTFGTVAPTDGRAREPWGGEGFRPAPIGYQFADQSLRYIVEADAAFDFHRFGVSADGFVNADALARFDRATRSGSISDAGSFEPFFAAGRKLILYHGFSDPALTPYRTINLYMELAGRAGGYDKLSRLARLFMVPGMQHCEGGPGPNVFDTLSALERWVESGEAPTTIIAAHHQDGDPSLPEDRKMPLCAFPAQARFTGRGSADEATSWICKPNTDLLAQGPSGQAAGEAVN